MRAADHGPLVSCENLPAPLGAPAALPPLRPSFWPRWNWSGTEMPNYRDEQNDHFVWLT